MVMRSMFDIEGDRNRAGEEEMVPQYHFGQKPSTLHFKGLKTSVLKVKIQSNWMDMKM